MCWASRLAAELARYWADKAGQLLSEMQTAGVHGQLLMTEMPGQVEPVVTQSCVWVMVATVAAGTILSAFCMTCRVNLALADPAKDAVAEHAKEKQVWHSTESNGLLSHMQ